MCSVIVKYSACRGWVGPGWTAAGDGSLGVQLDRCGGKADALCGRHRSFPDCYPNRWGSAVAGIRTGDTSGSRVHQCPPTTSPRPRFNTRGVPNFVSPSSCFRLEGMQQQHPCGIFQALGPFSRVTCEARGAKHNGWGQAGPFSIRRCRSVINLSILRCWLLARCDKEKHCGAKGCEMVHINYCFLFFFSLAFKRKAKRFGIEGL